MGLHMKKLPPRGEEGDMGLVCPRCTQQKQTNPKENQEANLGFFSFCHQIQ